jgi:hypothetical protein
MNEQQAILVQRLKEAGINTQRFLKVGHDKKAFEPSFQNNLYGPEDLANYPRWGIIGSDGLVLIDTDNEDLEAIFKEELPETLEVKSPRRGLPHRYYFVEGGKVENKTLYLNEEHEKASIGDGEVRAQNWYLVAPGTVINYQDLQTKQQKTGMYEVTKNKPIAKIPYNDLMKVIEPFLGKDKKQKITFEEMRNGVRPGKRHATSIKMASFIAGICKIKDYDAILFLLKDWNKKLSSPIDDEDLERAARNALGYIEQKEHPGATIEEMENFANNPYLLLTILNDLEKTVKYDIPIKIAVLMAGISTYNDPINLSLKGDSGVGKTYVSSQTVDYFPKEDVVKLGGMTPKAIIREHGVLMDAEGKPIIDEYPEKPNRQDYKDGNNRYDKEAFEDAKADYEKKKKAYLEKMKGSYNLIDLTNKILLFLETPSPDTIDMLKPILSHDALEIPYKFVDKTKNGPMKVVNVRVRGWPASIFLSVDKSHMTEFATRTFTATPSSDKSKIEAANQVTMEKESAPWEYEGDTKEKIMTQNLIRKIKGIIATQKIKVVNPFKILQEIFPKSIARDMRDFQHFTQLVKCFTVLRFFQRPIITVANKKYAVISITDVLEAKAVFDEIAESTRTGTDQKMIDFYHNFVSKHNENNGVTLEDLTIEYNEKNKETPLSDWALRFYLKRLNKIGYVDIREGIDPDKRKKRYFPLKLDETVGKTPIQIDLASDLQNDFENWLKTIAKNVRFSNSSRISFQDEIEYQISLDELKNLIINDTVLFATSTEPKTDTVNENKAKSVEKPEKQTVSAFPNGKKISSVEKPKPQFTYKTIPQGAPCGYCGAKVFNVTKEVLIPQGEIQRRCEVCFKKLYDKFKDGANFVEVGGA